MACFHPQYCHRKNGIPVIYLRAGGLRVSPFPLAGPLTSASGDTIPKY